MELGLIDKCRSQQSFMKELAEFAGAHVISLVCAHYPLINLGHLETGYPLGFMPKLAEELRVAQMELAAKLIDDLELCGELPLRAQEPVGTPSTSSQTTKPAVSTS